MRISDWISDVCSSDLYPRPRTVTVCSLSRNTRNYLRNSFGRAAIPEGIMRPRHGIISAFIVQKAENFRNDAIFVGADEPRGARLDALGSLGRLAHHEHRLAERGRLFLHAAAVDRTSTRLNSSP